MESIPSKVRDIGLRFGLIGCGGIGQLRAAALNRAGSLRLVAVSDLDQGRATAVASKYGGAVERDWRALLRRAEVDAVIVSTPPSLHAETNGRSQVGHDTIIGSITDVDRDVTALAVQQREGVEVGRNPTIESWNSVTNEGAVGGKAS